MKVFEGEGDGTLFNKVVLTRGASQHVFGKLVHLAAQDVLLFPLMHEFSLIAGSFLDN